MNSCKYVDLLDNLDKKDKKWTAKNERWLDDYNSFMAKMFIKKPRGEWLDSIRERYKHRSY